jgi:ABC-type lipoprotein export system ATPase subunit
LNEKSDQVHEGFYTRIKEVILASGSSINIDPDDFILVVGPNNSGKTLFLRELLSASYNPQQNGRLIREVRYEKIGSEDDAWNFVRAQGIPHPEIANPVEQKVQVLTESGSFAKWNASIWVHEESLEELAGLLVRVISTEFRLIGSNAPALHDFRKKPVSHPLHLLYRSGLSRSNFRKWFSEAFRNLSIGLDIQAGSVLALHVGTDAGLADGERDTDEGYLERLRSCPQLEQQGDGVRAYATILLYALFGSHQIVLVDEPEAFLHPPQAKQLASLLQREARGRMQIAMATHSGDVVRGVLQTSSRNLRVIRITRQTTRGEVHEISTSDVSEIWNDPTFFYSNALDGLFHDRVIVCEAESDCRFYSAVVSAVSEENGLENTDVLFLPSGGKAGVAKIIRALRKVHVPTGAVVDFDIFRDRGQFAVLAATVGLSEHDWRDSFTRIARSIEELGGRSAAAVITNIRKVLDECQEGASDQPISKALAGKVQKALKPATGWERAKASGLGVLDAATRRVAERLLDLCADRGLFIVPVGELEGFEYSIEARKSEWLREVFIKHKDTLNTARELEEARKFGSRIISAPATWQRFPTQDSQ